MSNQIEMRKTRESDSHKITVVNNEDLIIDDENNHDLEHVIDKDHDIIAEN